MKTCNVMNRGRSFRALILGVVPALALFTFVQTAFAEDNEARSILKAMSDYVSSHKTIEVTFDSSIEIITPELEKIQFTNSG